MDNRLRKTVRSIKGTPAEQRMDMGGPAPDLTKGLAGGLQSVAEMLPGAGFVTGVQKGGTEGGIDFLAELMGLAGGALGTVAGPADTVEERAMNEAISGTSSEVPLPKEKPDYSEIYYSNEVVPEEFGEYNFNDPTKYNKDSDSYVVYSDTKGKPTLGAGILVDKNFLKTIGKKKLKIGDTVPKDIVESVGLTRWKNSIKEARELLPNLSEDQILPLAEMVYQMGKPSVSKFSKTLKLYGTGEFKKAAKEALNSDWAIKDTPERAKRVAEKIRNLESKSKKQGGSVVERNPYNYQPKAI